MRASEEGRGERKGSHTLIEESNKKCFKISSPFSSRLVDSKTDFLISSTPFCILSNVIGVFDFMLSCNILNQ